jgi:hypothetical protein
MTTERGSTVGRSGSNGGGRRDVQATEPADYALINALYATLFAGVVYATRERAREQPLELRELVPLSLATFAVSKMIAREKVGVWVREPFVEHEGAVPQRPQGRRLRRAVGELVTCTRCVGAWSALGVVGLRMARPEAGRNVATVLAVSAANDWLQASFRWVCDRTD